MFSLFFYPEFFEICSDLLYNKKLVIGKKQPEMKKIEKNNYGMVL